MIGINSGVTVLMVTQQISCPPLTPWYYHKKFHPHVTRIICHPASHPSAFPIFISIPGTWNFFSVKKFQVRSEEHTSELQSHSDLVCRLLLEKKNKNNGNNYVYHNISGVC